MNYTIVGNVDLVIVALWLFVIFFAGLVVYLQRENMREGFPLERDNGTPQPSLGWPMPEPKTFRLPHGRGNVTVPDGMPERREIRLKPTIPSDGYPFEPAGDPLLDGVGPASWAMRRDVPELDGHGHPKIIPLSAVATFAVSAGRDPRGLPVQGGDLAIVGRVTDMWIDEPEQLVRYLEVELEGGGKRLIPLPLARIKRDKVFVHSIFGKHFPGVPTTKSRNQVTLLEEEKICAYYAGGKLYASEERQA